MKEQPPLERIRQFVKRRYLNSNHKELAFHTYGRCKKLLKAINIIAEPLGLNLEDRFVIMAAAWLHDIGYTEDPAGHEAAGLRLFDEFLRGLKLDGELIDRIKKLLLVTPGFHQPVDLLEEILCDAGTYYLAKGSFLRQNELQRKEQSALQPKKITKAEWSQESVCWITDHRYFTESARLLLEEKKQRNLTKLKCELPDVQSHSLDTNTIVPGTSAVKPLKKNKIFPEKGIDTMFKIASANNQRISAMADNKSRILITVNAIILSAIISLVLKKLDQDTYLVYPTFLLIVVSLVSIVFAILAIRPHDTSGKFTKGQLESREVNMLFYGNFHQMAITEFRAAMLGVMENNEQVYGSLIDDLYGQGTAVGKKYRLLRVAYTVFMFGLVIAMLAFIIATAAHYQTADLPAAINQ
jgi:hypothetical protein